MGSCYLNALFEKFSSSGIALLGVVEPNPKESDAFVELTNRNIPVFSRLDEFYQKSPPADLVIISSPVHRHVAQSCEALRHGSFVLCEKPLAATVQEAQQLISEARISNLWVEIGYQWSFSETIQVLKKDIIQGRFGRPHRLRTLCFWPRDFSYFQRNDWAGKKMDEEGHWILDSPANNAMAHFLHNVFYILGDRPGQSALPKEVEAELYRAYPIENYDSVASRVWTVGGVEVLFYASHTTWEELGPMFSFEFEKGTVSYGENGNTVVFITRNGEEIDYGSPEKDPFRKLVRTISAVHTALPVICGPEAAFAQTLCINGIQESQSKICPFPDSMVMKDQNRIWVDGLAEEFYTCYQKGILPSERGLPWACSGKSVDLQNYEFFPREAHSRGDL